ncbi:MAG: hypothetical protein WCN95_11260 [bacterium]
MILTAIRITILVALIAYIVWIIRSLARKRFRTAAVLIAIGMLIVGAAVFAIYKTLSITVPYLIEPTSVRPAAPGATVGYVLKGRTISVVSSNSIICISDPGVSFQYEVVWLVPKSQPIGKQDLMEFIFPLPAYADARHINGPDVAAPPDIKTVASEGKWR